MYELLKIWLNIGIFMQNKLGLVFGLCGSHFIGTRIGFGLYLVFAILFYIFALLLFFRSFYVVHRYYPCLFCHVRQVNKYCDDDDDDDVIFPENGSSRSYRPTRYALPFVKLIGINFKVSMAWQFCVMR